MPPFSHWAFFAAPQADTGGGVFPAGSNPVVSFTGAGIVKVKTYNVKTPSSGVISGIQPGDAFSIRLDRLADNAAGNRATMLFATNALVQYESAP